MKEARARKTNHQREHRVDENVRNAQETSVRSAQETLDEAARAGKRITEEAFQCWYRMLNGAGWLNQVERLNDTASNFVPLARRNWDELFAMWQTSAHAATELFSKTLESGRLPFADRNQEKMSELWASAVKTAQNNIGAVTQFATRTMESWTQFARGEREAAAESRS